VAASRGTVGASSLAPPPRRELPICGGECHSERLWIAKWIFVARAAHFVHPRCGTHQQNNSAVRADAMRQLQISRDGGFRASRTSNARPHIQVGARRVYSPSTSGQLRARPRRDRPLPWAYRPLARRAWPLPVCSRQLGGVAVLIARRLQARTREVQAGAAHRTRRLQKDVRDIIWRAKLAARTVLAQPPILPARARTPTAPASCVTRSQLMRRCCSHIGAYTLPGLSSCCRCSHIDV
jgi:hypothetical protein